MNKPNSVALGSIFVGLCLLAGQALCQIPVVPVEDEVVFLNGDRLSGIVDLLDQNEIVLNNRVLGRLRIDWGSVLQVRSHERSWRMKSATTDPTAPYSAYQTASFTNESGWFAVELDSRQVRIPKIFSIQLANQDHKTAGPVVAAPEPPSTGANVSVDIGLNSPVTVVDGTASQETFGGTVRLLVNLPDLCKPASWFTALQLMANHNRAWKIKSPAIVTDTFDGNLTIDHGIDSKGKFDVFMVADMWGNSSLGVGLQQSYGGGLSTTLYDTSCGPQTNHQLVITAKAGPRYLHQRLYAPGGPPLDLAGLRMETAATYQPFKKGTKDPLLTLQGSLWAMPMINNSSAIQAGGFVGIIFPLTKSLSLSLTEEDDFVNNAPKAKRKNYLKSGATLKFAFPPPPKT